MKSTVVFGAFGCLLSLLGIGISDWRFYVIVLAGGVLYETGQETGR